MRKTKNTYILKVFEPYVHTIVLYLSGKHEKSEKDEKKLKTFKDLRIIYFMSNTEYINSAMFHVDAPV